MRLFGVKNSLSFGSLFLAIGLLVMVGCRDQKFSKGEDLPLPPIGDSGVADGCYIQAEYGFSIPIPTKWFAFAGGEDWDELVRFSDPERKINAGLYARWLYEKEKFGYKGWILEVEKEYEKQGTTFRRLGREEEWNVEGGSHWRIATYELKDNLNREHIDTVCVMNHKDLLIWSHITLLKKDASKAPKLIKFLQDSFSKTRWYRPIGSRGITLENYELRKFDQNFIEAFKSQSAVKVIQFFDDNYPEKEQWIAWYKKFAAPAMKDKKDTATLEGEVRGLVIQEKQATVSFHFKRLVDGKEIEAMDQAFSLSKAEGSWRILSSIATDKK